MEEFDKLIGGSKPTLVDFYATWCGPCKMQSPILEQLKQTVGDKATIIKVDIDRNEELANRYRVQSVPTLIIFQNGEPVWRASGLHQAADLEAKINETLVHHD
ncbi:MAG: thioredoxin [Muribaculaceae bacterium]|nr:thioredoxin [Muribaculaceae bacterium]